MSNSATPWIAALQASLFIIKSQSLLKLMPIKSVMPSNHLILCHPLLLLPSNFPSNESVLHIRWPKYWHFSFRSSSSNDYPGLISFRIDWFNLLAVQGTLKYLLQHQSSVQSLSHVRLLATPWTATCQASLCVTNSLSLLKPISIETVMPSSHLILCRPLLLLPSIFPSIRVFSNESAVHIRWPKYWSFSFIISLPMNTQDWSPLGWTGWISLKSKGLSRVFSNTTVQKHQFFGTQLSSQSNSHIHTWPLEEPQPLLDRPLLTK